MLLLKFTKSPTYRRVSRRSAESHQSSLVIWYMKLLKWATAEDWMTACIHATRGNLRLVITPSFSSGQSSKGHWLMVQESTDFWNPLRRALGLNTLVLKGVCWIVLKCSQVELTCELFSLPKGTLPALKTREEGSISHYWKVLIETSATFLKTECRWNTKLKVNLSYTLRDKSAKYLHFKRVPVSFYDFIKKIFQITLDIVVMLVTASGLF